MSDKIRKKYASDLQSLHSILDRENCIKNLKPLYDSIQKCKKAPFGNDELWNHEMISLNLGPIHSLKKVRPKNLKDLYLTLTIRCIGECQVEPDYDNVNTLNFDIRIKAEDSEKKNFLTSWHLDCHIIEEGDGEPDHCHPLFHFQHGGKTILGLYEDDEYDFGSSLFLESPRIAFPPMDIPLGINFVLSQFYGDSWRRLRKDRTYLNIIENSQKRLWKPYFAKLTSYFESPKPNEPAKILIPDLI